MAFSEQTIIELREINAHLNNAPGDYQIALKDPIPLYPDDMIEIKSSYIDSVEASSGDVIIDKDTDVKITFSPYMMNWAVPDRLAPTYLAGPSVINPDARPYFACEKAVEPDMSKVYAVAEIVIYRQDANRNGGAWGRDPKTNTTLTIPFIFESPARVKTTRSIIVPYNTGTSDKLVLNHETDPNLFPWFIFGEVTNPHISIQVDTSNINLGSDNVNIDALLSGNQGPASVPNTYTNKYTGFSRLTSFKFLRGVDEDNLGPLVSPGMTVRYKDWTDGLVKNSNITFTQSVDADSITIAIDPALDIVVGSQTQPVTVTNPVDSAKNITYIGPQPFPGVIDGAACPLQGQPTPNIQTVDENGSSSFFFADDKLVYTPVSMGLALNIKTFTETVTIPAGSYPLAQLCEKLTDGFSGLTTLSQGNTFTNFPSNNRFLVTNNQLRELNNITDVNEPQYYCREDGQALLSFGATSPGDPFIGTDTVAFIADPVLNKVKISSIHSSIYDTTGSMTPITRYTDIGNGKSIMLGKNGGVVFTDIQPLDFFSKLGFTNNPNETIFNTPTHNTVNIQGQDILTESLKTKEGQFTTQALSGLNNAILKSKPYVFDGLTSLNGQAGSVQATVEIVATNSVAQAGDNDGYFMIEISGIPKSNIVGSKLDSNKIHSIVSRYYQAGNFTTSYNEGSMSIQYKGEPTVLSNFKVRILNGDGQLTKDVNSKSCVFLELTRNQPQTTS